MKRLLIALLLVLLLAGCSAKPQQPAPTETTPTTQSTQPSTPTEPVATEPNIYVPESAPEQDASGAVCTYDVGTGNWFGLSNIGADVLVTGENTMLRLSGEQGCGIKTTLSAVSANTEMDTYTTGVAYYEPQTRNVTVLNAKLQTVSQLKLPETVVGTPVISLIRNEVYYFTGTEIRAMNLTNGISRLLRQQNSMETLLPDDYFDGNVLSCRIKDAAGTVRTEYFSSETGQTFSQDQGISEMQTAKDRFFIRRMDGQVHQLIFGTRDGEPQSFLVSTGDDSVIVPVLAMNGVVTCKTGAEGLDLSFYNLTTGKRTAQASLAGMESVQAIHSEGTYVWILAKQGQKQLLLRWDIAKSPVQDEGTYTGPFYTPENPDTEGLQECKKLADSYSGKYGVKLNTWQDAVKVTGDYTVVAEHQPQVINKALNELDAVMSQFPSRFLMKNVKGSYYVWIQVSLVRSIEGDRDWATFQKDDNWWFVISTDTDVAKAFIQCVAYAVDSYVLGNSRDFDFDRWNPLNPKDFIYANGNDVEPRQEYLEGDTQAFTDVIAMSNIREDRCRIFYNAMLEDNADMFKSPAMQAKLHRICLGIREAYGLQKSEKTYIWEQYLTTSLAYVK